MTIGIPRALLYHRYGALWERFFEALGVETVTSGPTDLGMLRRGSLRAVDEACLATKIFLGHVDALLGRADVIFVPRIASEGQRDVLCTHFMALPDVVWHTFRDQSIRLLDMNIDIVHDSREMPAFLLLGKQLGFRRAQALYAYMYAKQAEQVRVADALRDQERRLMGDGMRVLLVGQSYALRDALIGKPICERLQSRGIEPVFSDIVDLREAREACGALLNFVPWVYSREMAGAVELYRDRVDGIVLLGMEPCGPGALVYDVLRRRVTDVPMTSIGAGDEEDLVGLVAGMESFLDAIFHRKELGIVDA